MKIVFHPEAEKELENSFLYYEAQHEKLGQKFLNEIEKSLERIKIFSLSSPVIENDIRRCLVNRFPYGIIYFIQNKKIIVLAIMHLRKKPYYWENRKRNYINEN